MARPLREKELYRAITKNANSNDVRQGEKYYKALLEVVISELSTVGEVTLPKIGKLVTHRIGGEVFTKFQEPGYSISFQCANHVKDMVNGKTKKPMAKHDPRYLKLQKDMQKYKDLQAQSNILRMLDGMQQEEQSHE